MDADIAKIRLKIGAVEVEYEGKASFLHDGLLSLMSDVVGFYREHEAALTVESSDATNVGKPSAVGKLDLSTNTIAAHIDAKTAADLVIAAAAHLTLVKGKDKFTRSEITTEMKEATTFFQQNMIGNLSKALSTLTKNKRLNQSAKDVYALSSSELTNLEAKLAQAG